MSKQRTKAKEMLRVEMHKAIRGVGLESGMGFGDVIEVLREVEDDLISALWKKLEVDVDDGGEVD